MLGEHVEYRHDDRVHFVNVDLDLDIDVNNYLDGCTNRASNHSLNGSANNHRGRR